jgi:hypothetical protein
MAEYWLARNSQKYGPYSVDVLQRMMTEGRAAGSDLAWKEGMTAWEPLSRVLPRNASVPDPPYSPSFAQGDVPRDMVPPSLHWLLVLILSAFTLGVFSWIWSLREAGFVKRIDRGSSVMILMVFAVIGQIATQFFYVLAMATNNSDERLAFLAIEMVFYVVSAIFFLIAAFQMRRSLLHYYNLVEPIGLRLSGGMTFFFSIFYLQHHFSRIAKWKQTGYLEPQ